MKWVNKKRTRKAWTAVPVDSNKVFEAERWCRRHKDNATGWYKGPLNIFYFQDPAVATELAWRFG